MLFRAHGQWTWTLMAIMATYVPNNVLLTTSTWSGVASYPGSRWAGKQRVWNPLFTHTLNFTEILGNQKLCVISVQTWRHNVYSPLYHLYNDGSILIICSPAPSSSLQQLGTSDMNLKKVQVATSLGFAWKNTCLYSYSLVSLRDTVMWYHGVAVCNTL